LRCERLLVTKADIDAFPDWTTVQLDLNNKGDLGSRPEPSVPVWPPPTPLSANNNMSTFDLIGEAVLSTHSDAIIEAGRDGIIGFWNPGAERIFGFTSQEAIGHSLDLIIPERLRQRHWDGYDKTLRTGESRYGAGDLLAVPALRKDGTTISVEFTVVPLKNEKDQMIGMIAVIRDVTKRFEEMRSLKRKLADATKVPG
jgi:nitric oxide dioxygenase